MIDMKFVAWDQDKNERLKDERGISFEEVMDALIDERVIGRFPHPNQERYPHQQVYVVALDEYVYIIPFVEDEEKIFLKTIYPSRKFTKKYIEKGGI